MGYYQSATICLNGHVLSYTTKKSSKYCEKCGLKTISHCESCNKEIKGEYSSDFLMPLLSDYTKPFYCEYCSNAFPWTEKILNNAVELVTLDEELTAEYKEIIKSALPDLIVETPVTPVAVAKYNKYMESSAGFIKDGMKNLLINVVSDQVRKSIWG